MQKIKVLWICSFSTEELRNIIPIQKIGIIERVLYRLLGRNDFKPKDSAIWNVNAIKEFENFSEIELHILCPVRKLKSEFFNCTLRGVNYHFFLDENSSLIRKIIRQCWTKHTSLFRVNRRRMQTVINIINPDLVHIMGAENPLYSLAALDISRNTPVFLQLQTLITRLVDITKDSTELLDFQYKSELEKSIILRADYIGAVDPVFAHYIRKHIKHDACLLDTVLAMGNKINRNEKKHETDFVYFSANISKAGDLVIEAFCKAHKEEPNLTLKMIGDYSEAFYQKLCNILETNNAFNSVVFTGLLPTHEDVIKEIRKARCAVLPLRLDLVPNTIHESLANGLPVLTTINEGTPYLNKKRKTVLLSDIDDVDGLCNNMLLISRDKELYSTLSENSYLTEEEFGSNHERMIKWKNAYMLCLDNFHKGTVLPSNIIAD